MKTDQFIHPSNHSVIHPFIHLTIYLSIYSSIYLSPTHSYTTLYTQTQDRIIFFRMISSIRQTQLCRVFNHSCKLVSNSCFMTLWIVLDSLLSGVCSLFRILFLISQFVQPGFNY